MEHAGSVLQANDHRSGCSVGSSNAGLAMAVPLRSCSRDFFTRSRDQCSSDLPLSASGNDFRSIDPVRIRKAAARCETCTMDVGLLTACQVDPDGTCMKRAKTSNRFGIIKNLEFHFLTGSLLQPRIASLLCWCRE